MSDRRLLAIMIASIVILWASAYAAHAQIVVDEEVFPHLATFVSDTDPRDAVFEYEFSRASIVEPWFEVETGTPFVAYVCFEQVVDLPYPDGELRQRVIDLNTGEVSEWAVVVVPEPGLATGLAIGALALGSMRGRSRRVQTG